MSNTLLLALQGPLQAWGERARWDVRDTALTPTKSGIVGLLGCALGISDDDALRDLSAQITVGVRCDRPGTRLTDLHTVTGGVLAASGKIKINANTREPEGVRSWRDYLADAAFVVAVRGPEALIARCAEALRAPVWPPYLGRKSCPPSRPLLEGTGDYPSVLDALQAWPRLDDAAGAPDAGLRAIVPTAPGTGLRRNDELVSRRRRTFLPRYVRETIVYPPPRECNPCTSPN
ncbi:MAG TPA: type I-E CRISPR-associated protein Cas5/CasD [Chloroflexi bacterium]|jgi:CRISPR system Cascade subunit CasD|nr:type I-E CRISPR-associated protein Cas5/CasD [Chloroflexota bacterium]